MASSIKKNNKIGSIYCDGIEYDNNVRFKSGAPDDIIREFLHKLTVQFSVEAARRMYITEQACTLISKEQVMVVLTQALGTITNTFLVKPQFQGNHAPVARIAYSGLDAEVDFWIVYEGIIILLSFGNEVTSITSSRVGKTITSNWTSLIEKLDKVKYNGSLMDSNDYRIYKVSLDILTLFRKVDSMEEYVGNSNLSGWKHRLHKNLDPNPNWSCCWELNIELAGPYEYTDTIEVYPAVTFLAHIKAIHNENKVYKGERFDCLAVVENKKRRNRVAGDWIYFGYQKVSIEKPKIIEV